MTEEGWTPTAVSSLVLHPSSLILVMPTTIWTIGHSNHPWPVFLGVLVRHRIETVVDVRSSPYSRYASQFNREVLHATLVERAMQYVFLGDLLGGRGDDERFYDDQGRVLYGEVAQSPGFGQGIKRLLAIAAQSRAAILCGEENPAECHRRLLVGRVLGERGIGVVHLRGDGRAQTEPELAAEEKFRQTGGQLSLFDSEEPGQWKSIQSVLPKKAPQTFSPSSAELESGD
jgi:uncharacterized protein (DUF488 family)